MLVKTCRAGGCTRPAVEGSHYCIEHQANEARDRERARFYQDKARKEFKAKHGINAELYNTYKWKVMRQNQLAKEPLCAKCGGEATEVHHLIPPKGDPDIFYDESNLVSLCHICHWQETRREMQEAKAEKACQSRKIWY